MSDDPPPPKTFPLLDGVLSHVIRTRFYVIENSDLLNEEDVSELVGRLYDYPEDSFYFYKQHDHPTNLQLQAAVDAEVISMTEWELNFYPHPNFKRDYVQLYKERLTWDWQRQVILTSPMFVRFVLKLTTKARRALEHQQLIAAHKEANKNPVELKPNFMGLGIDVYKAIEWLRSAINRSR